jgi:DNA polymerase-4
VILHVDMDAFYASVEQRDRPELVGLPLIVGGTSGRGVVAAASYEVRKFGVRSAMPIRRALQLCPHAVCVRPRMARYAEVSAQVFAVFHEFTPLVQGLSLDEAYLDVTASRALKGDAVTIAREIKRRIRERTGLAASVGIAPNKLVAKIASDLEKPDGLTVVTEDRIHAVLDPLPVKRLPGLGRKKGDEVMAAGIATLGALRGASERELRPLFGADWQSWQRRAAGIDDRAVDPDRDDKSVSAEHTFATDLAEPAALTAELARLADKVAARLRAKEIDAGCVTVKIRRHDFVTQTRQMQIVPATRETRVLAEAAQRLLAEWLRAHPRAKLRLLGVGASDLQTAVQPDLFDAPVAIANRKLDAAVDAIKQRFGHDALSRANGLRAMHESVLGDATTSRTPRPPKHRTNEPR